VINYGKMIIGTKKGEVIRTERDTISREIQEREGKEKELMV
jgi:hypothetical protein